MENDIADEQTRKETEPMKNTSETTTTLRRPPSGALPEGHISHEGIHRMYSKEEEKLDRREEPKLLRREQMMMGHLRSGLDPELKYWLLKVGRSIDTIWRKCVVVEETAEHVMHDCPRIHHHELHEPTPPDTPAKDPLKVLRIWEKWTSVLDLPDVSQPGVTTT